MKIMIPIFALLLPGIASAQGIVGDFQIYLGTIETAARSQVIISLPEGRLTAGPGIAAELRDSFNLTDMALLQTPRMVVAPGHSSAITVGFSSGGGVPASPVVPFKKLYLKFAPCRAVQGTLDLGIAFAVDDQARSELELSARLNETITLASRQNGHLLFILCTFRDLAADEIPPRPLLTVNPEYPPELIRAHVAGDVAIRARVDAQGRLVKAEVVLSGRPEFDQPALEAVRKWVWQAGTRKGVPAEMDIVFNVLFRLN